MTNAALTHFVQECPTCGRRLQVRVSLLGRSIGCPHCQAEFVASLRSEPGVQSNDLLARAEMLLNSSESSEVGRSLDASL